MLLHLVAQMDPSKITDGVPPLQVESSYAVAWAIAAIVTLGVLFVTFKTSRRNLLDRD